MRRGQKAFEGFAWTYAVSTGLRTIRFGAVGLARAMPRYAKLSRVRATAWVKSLGEWRKRAMPAWGKRPDSTSPTVDAPFAGRRRLVILASGTLMLALPAAIALLAGGPSEGPQEVSATLVIEEREPPVPDAAIDTAWTKDARAAIQAGLAKRAAAGDSQKREQDALSAYYSNAEKPLLWIDEEGLTDRARSVIKEIASADDYGLRAADYHLPRLDGGQPTGTASIDQLAAAEIALDDAVLRYVRDARGGRLDPSRLPANLSPSLALPDPLEVLNALPAQTEPATYLRSFHPNYPQFEALRKKLMALRSGDAAKPKTSQVEIPSGSTLKLGDADPQVVLLRQRLNVPAGRSPTMFDEAVEQAVKNFQQDSNLSPDGVVGPSTRQALNASHSRRAGPASQIKTILLNMERWRWLPRDTGAFSIMVNVPEFTLRVTENDKTLHTARVVVGKPGNQTPVFSDKMETLVFGPFWNVPNSIKVEEIRPYLQQELWFFGGWNTSILTRHNLRVSYRGRDVDPGSLDWDRIDIRSLHIYQPPGPNNVLGKVKFMFPNKHDVYLHDTVEKGLFGRPVRAESHGCVRVENPGQLASMILKRDQDWSEARTMSAMENGYDQRVALNQTIPVHITYFTAWVDDNGSMSTFRDIYGHDARMAAALFGDSIAPAHTAAVSEPREPRQTRTRRVSRGWQDPWDRSASDDIVGSIIQLFDN